ncbi:MAG: FtsX-like permease family protein [Sporocytophaga sp.]|uniref:ABC transporter permease n=1 Tax=Sporocytophaga sp. TaxID=2231183 RepID=UPI001B1910B4|nr:FtsX-like permease family protein [Sporocytophaga sp.]MBO9703322.1 FtsX-like permease family protein [Sporocytophaga sp.]
MKCRKSYRDLLVNPGKTFLAILALVLGIGGIGTILVSYTILTHDLNANFQCTQPAHVVFQSEQFDKLNLNEFIQIPEVEIAEFRDFSLHRIEVRKNEWIPLWLYGVESFEKYQVAQVFYESGLSKPSQGSMLIERDGLKASDITMGGSPRIRIGSRTMEISVTGICFDPAQAPATQDAFIYAYTDKDTYHKVTGLPVNQRLLVRLNEVSSGEDVTKKVEKIKQAFQASGINLTSVYIPKFNEHPHQWQLNTLLFLIGTIGLLAFFMGVVLVSQLMRSILASQVRQIGILKSLGGSRFQVLQIYLIMLLIIGIISGIIAIPLAVKAGIAFSSFIAGILNFNILTFSLPVYVYISLITSSIMLPILLSFPILWKSTSVSVKDALNDYGINGVQNIGEFKLLRNWSLSESFILASRNAFRNSRRLSVTIFSMALGAAIFSTGFNVRQSLWDLLEGVKNEMRYDVQVVLKSQIDEEHALMPFKSIDNVKMIESWIGGRGEIQSRLLSTDKGAGIVALPADTKLLKLKVTSGRWLSVESGNEIVMNQQAWNLYRKPEIGSSVTLLLGNKCVSKKVVGIIEEFDKAKIYIDLEQYNTLFNPQRLVNSLMFVAKDKEYSGILKLKREIESAIVSSDLDVLYVMSQSERVKIIYDHLNIILTIILLLSFLVLVVSGVGMTSATSINIGERTREIGVMRAIGATPKKIYKIFVNEGMIISCLSIILGLILSFPLSKLAGVFFGNLILGDGAKLKYAFSLVGFIITILITALFGFLASTLPARRAIKIPTHKALSYE